MIADDVRRGLSGSPKKLPAYLFYDDLGSRMSVAESGNDHPEARDLDHG
jgi:uncharacterized SAM-dependent methyltransferase